MLFVFEPNAWFFFLVLLVKGIVMVEPSGPFFDEAMCNKARIINVPELYPVLDITSASGCRGRRKA